MERAQNDWELAEEFYPDLLDINNTLSALSHEVAAKFRTTLLETKKFDDRHKLAGQLQDEFLTATFGRDSKIQRFGLSLLLSGNGAAAAELHRIISVLGAPEPDVVISRIRRQFHIRSQPIPHRSNQKQIAMQLMITQSPNDAYALVHALGGEFSWTVPPGGVFEVLVLKLDGEDRHFDGYHQMTQWLVAQIAPALVNDSQKGVGRLKDE